MHKRTSGTFKHPLTQSALPENQIAAIMHTHVDTHICIYIVAFCTQDTHNYANCDVFLCI